GAAIHALAVGGKSSSANVLVDGGTADLELGGKLLQGSEVGQDDGQCRRLDPLLISVRKCKLVPVGLSGRPYRPTRCADLLHEPALACLRELPHHQGARPIATSDRSQR